jgi:hypothetical protein
VLGVFVYSARSAVLDGEEAAQMAGASALAIATAIAARPNTMRVPGL